MIGRITGSTITLQEAMNYWDLRSVLEVLNPLLVEHGYEPVFFFEGTPVLGQGGFSVIIKLSKELAPSDRRLVKRILEANGFKVVEEDQR
ncbi:hypothetical protein [Desulfurococcus mucosus]|uniref:DUF2007 domain-containing protein n=1 Tax=Desulfurococcus mucosus (strain ATCC 35584 / DSM 2162 / JCM 9187 / O7/1) TaxID=765177 RepID=E8R866_DESM0|nr:hypothetical protein [Desulfurococcus mucosus]ADV64692.1 hypothetical protein Desmu_0373 [Desulfurococcus mucosus DSM 2162]